MKSNYPYHGSEIAIIGMAARFPGADSIDEFWQNLCLQREGIRFFTDEELVAVGVSEELLQDPTYVKAKGIIRDCNDFDAAFFNYSDREAVLMDPQLRLYHECAWHALEDSGYTRKGGNELIGVFGGASANALWTAQYALVAEQGGAAAYEIINVISRDFFNSRLAYKLDLKGPAVTVQTACSTALVAVHQACQSLLSGDSDIALAGAVSLSLNPALSAPEQQGYRYQEGMILSPDGHCRPFDQDAQGTVLSDGVGFVVLKRLQEAIDDGDHIYATIKGSAINNDGNEKIGYTAPSVTGQREVVEAALNIAGVDAGSVGYIEAHGTGTNLGDPIEMQALLQAYDGFQYNPCYLGSVKSNLGHLDTAAGIAGLIKTVLTVNNAKIPATLHFAQLNSKCDLSTTQLQIANTNHDWQSDKPLRAAVSSFGIGGTNAHVIVEEYIPPLSANNQAPAWSVLPLSAKTETSLKSYKLQLSQWLPSAQSISDVAYTLAERRTMFDVRQGIIVNDKGEVVFASAVGQRKVTPNIYWMFSGQGTQYLQMGKGLYESEPAYKSAVNQCLALIHEMGGPDIHDLILGTDTSDEAELRLRRTDVTQLTLFTVGYALSQLLLAWGVQPKGCIGHSLGEYVAACLSGVFSLPDALKLVLARARLMVKTEAGAMLAVHQNIASFDATQWPGLSIAAVNTEQDFVVAGTEFQINTFADHMNTHGVGVTPLRTSHAFHSALMDPILAEFTNALRSININRPKLPIISNVSGDWVEPDVMATVDYWVSHLRETVVFHKGLTRLLQDEQAVLLEIGPGKTLTSFARQHPARGPMQLALNSLRSARETEPDALSIRRAVAELYAEGVAMDWRLCNPTAGKLCSLPPYAFDRQTYLSKFKGFGAGLSSISPEGFYQQHWVGYETAEWNEHAVNATENTVLLLRDGSPDEEVLIRGLMEKGFQLIEVRVGESFKRLAPGQYQLRPDVVEDYLLLGQELARATALPVKVIQLWQARSAALRYRPFSGLLLLTQAFNQLGFSNAMSIYAVAEGAYRVNGDEQLNPDSALVYGPIRVIGQEYPHIRCHLLEIKPGSLIVQAGSLVSAICSAELPLVTALRGDLAWRREFTALGENWQAKTIGEGFRQEGVYLITGGFGGLGAELARYLAREYKARLVLCGRQDRRDHPLLAEIDSLGGRAIAIEADTRNAQAIDDLVDSTLSHFGAINGIIHTAGTPGETMIQRHRLETAIDVIATKLATATRMVDMTEKHSLDLLVFFSSVTGILGGLGQIDYCAANAGLDAVAESARTKGLRQVYSIRWDAWREAGMALDALNGKLNILERTGHPFVGDLLSKNDTVSIYRQEINAHSCWALDEHWVMGVPTIAGTTYLEMVGAAYTRQTGLDEKYFSDIYFLAPLSLTLDESADVYTRLVKEGDFYHFEVGSYHRQHQRWQLHARGQISAIPHGKSSLALSLVDLKTKYTDRYINEIQGAAHLGVLAMGVSLSKEQQDALMKYGERWAVVQEVWLGSQSGLAKLQLPLQFHGDMAKMLLHPSMLDCALSFLRAFLDGGVYIPISYHSMVQYKPLPAAFYSHVCLTSALDKQLGVMSFDIQLVSCSGVLLAEIHQFTMRRIEADFASANLTGRTLPIPDFVHQFRPMSQGITRESGLQALEQIVSSAHPLTLVAASDFAKRHANADQGDMGLFSVQHMAAQQVRSRPEISVEYVAPRTPQQQQLAEVWQQMLGYEQVGIQDDFFELGGDSLLLMQIHKKVQSLFNNNIAIVELYNHPTIQRLVDHINAQQNNQVDTALEEVSNRIDRQKAAAARRRQARVE
jgi:phthiocerol/phenolphthiocerol synthesis type-I polyketide synthase E